MQSLVNLLSGIGQILVSIGDLVMQILKSFLDLVQYILMIPDLMTSLSGALPGTMVVLLSLWIVVGIVYAVKGS